MNFLRRAALAYYRGNVAAWAALRRWLAFPVIDSWQAAGLAQLAAVVTLLGSGHQDAAWIVAVTAVWLPVLQRFIDR